MAIPSLLAGIRLVEWYGGGGYVKDQTTQGKKQENTPLGSDSRGVQLKH